jgi:hypothetical protein
MSTAKIAELKDTAGAMVLLRRPTPPDAEGMARFLNRSCRGSAEMERVEAQPKSLRFDYAGMAATVGLSDLPVPWPEVGAACKASRMWPGASDALRGHVAHVLVSLGSGGKDLVDKQMRLTELVAAAVDDLADHAAGVYWRTAGLTHEPDSFIAMAKEMTREALPLELWVDFRLSANPDRTFNLATTGLTRLGQPELEVRSAKRPAEVVHETAFNVAHYLLDKSGGLPVEVFRDGETMDLSDAGTVTVRVGPSLLDKTRSVIRLEM